MTALHPYALSACLAFVFTMLAFAPGYANQADGSLTVTRITPSGEDVPAERQIVIEFDRPVVPLGRMERSASEIPVEISPKVDCEWRWLSASSLACQLRQADALTPSTRYTITLNPGLKALDDTTLSAPLRHEFITSRIALDRSEFLGWSGPGNPSILVTFNQPVRRDTVVNRLSFIWQDNSGGKLPVHANPGPDWSLSPHDKQVAVPREPGLRGLFNRLLAYLPWFRSEAVPGAEEWARRAWLVTPKVPLPLDTDVELDMKPGLISGLGSEPSVVDQQVQKFATFGAFRFLGARCTKNDGTELTIRPDENPTALCGPWNVVRLVFSSPVKLKEIRDHIQLSPELGRADPETDPWTNVNPEQTEGFYPWKIVQKGDEFTARFPIFLRSNRDYEASLKPDDKSKIVDMFGRTLEGPLAVRWRMDNRPPNFELPNNIAVLEKAIDSDVPLYVNNLTSRKFNFSRLTAQGIENGLSISEKLNPVQNLQYAVPFGIRDMLHHRSGAILGDLSVTPKLPNDKQGMLFSQVTPFGLHVKQAHYNTLIWVTDLATAQPVSGAKVMRYRDPALMNALCEGTVPAEWPRPYPIEASAVTDADGMAMLPGIAPTAGVYESPCSKALTIRVEKGDDIALMPLNYHFEADTYRASGEQIWPQDQAEQEHMRVWGTTAQGVYRAGDTIQYKIYVRGQNNEGLTAGPPSSYRLQLVDPTGKLVADVKSVALSEFGTASGEVSVPKSGAVGWYKFRLLQKLRMDPKEPEGTTTGDGEQSSTDAEGALESGWYAWRPMQVLVSDFTPASFRVSTNVNGKIFTASQSAQIEGKAELHSGGPYTNAKARITAVFDPMAVSSSNPLAASFDFSRSDREISRHQKMIAQLEVPLNAQGLAKTSIVIPDQGDDTYGNLTFEVAVADDRGKNIANSIEATYAATDRFVGLKPTAWIFQANKPASYQYIVIDAAGAPQKDTSADLKVERKLVTAARVKSAGNTYQTVYNTSWEASGSCSGTPDAAPATCTFTPKEAGEYRVIATVKGHNGKSHTASSEFWVAGSDVVLWDSEPDTALQMFSEKASYKVGETARYLIKNPYPNARALITIERYGVIDRFVQTFTTSTPIVEFPVKPNYAPGFYVSIVLVSPRVDKPIDAMTVDLGKPAFRMGYISVPVTDPYNEMQITSKTEREEYRPGEIVKVDLHAKPRNGDRQEPVEFAVAVLDQAVFDLVTGGSAYFDPYRGLYRLDNLDVHNFNLLLKLVGRQKFEKKGANPGGDGGADFKFRDDSRYVAYWNPSLLADAKGNAKFQFTAPDNLTGWRVLALAVTPTDKAGLGEGGFKVNRPTEIRPVMPNQVMEGDKFIGRFSVMNRTAEKRHLKVAVGITGDILDAEKTGTVTREIDVDPFQRSIISVPLVAGRVSASGSSSAGEIKFSVTAGDSSDMDSYAFNLPVRKHVDLVTATEYGSTDEASAETSIAFPKSIRTDEGGLSVTLSPTVVTDLAGAFRYIADYPFQCWEQQLTKGVMASAFSTLRQYLPASAKWENNSAILKDALKNAADFQAPNGGMTYWVSSNERVDPYLSAYTALSFSWLRDRGVQPPAPVDAKLKTYLQGFLRRDEAPAYYTADMTASVRALSLAALAHEGRVTTRDIERLRPQFKTMGLYGNAMLLQAASSIKDENSGKLAREFVDMILAHSNQTSGKFLFSQETGKGFSRILATPLRDNCAILSSFVAYGKQSEQKEYVAQASFKLARSISQSQRGEGYWGNTQENMFCTNALADYARAYETAPVNLRVSVALDGNEFGAADLAGAKSTPVSFTHLISEADQGRNAKLTIKREGSGRLYYANQLSNTPLATNPEPVNSGIEIRREYSVERGGKWLLLGEPAEVKHGELVRVDLFLSLPAPRSFVVVEDPVPGGLEPVNRDLATASSVDADMDVVAPPEGSWRNDGKEWIEYASTFWSFYHRELRNDSARFYSDYLDAGNYHLTYVAQTVASGSFTRRPAKAAEMYDPDVFGLGTPGVLIVADAP